MNENSGNESGRKVTDCQRVRGLVAHRERPRVVMPGHGKSSAGLTLIELLTSIAVLSIVLSIAVPAMNNFFDSKRLVGAAEQVYSHLQQARIESIARSSPIFVNFAVNGSGSWSYGVSHRSLCDLSQVSPTGANACVLVVDDGDGNVDPGDGTGDSGDLVLMRFADVDHIDVTMDIDSFSSGSTQVRFDPLRGTATSGAVVLQSAAGRRLDVAIGLLGQIRICSPDGSMTGYSTANC